MCKAVITNKNVENKEVKAIISQRNIYCPFYLLNIDDLTVIKRAKSAAVASETEASLFIPRSGCQWIGQLNELRAHLSDSCKSAPTTLIMDGDVITPRRLLSLDICSDDDQRAESIDAIRPETPMICPFACHGCTAIVRRKDYAQHQANSAVKHAALVAAKLTAQEMRISQAQVPAISTPQSTSTQSSVPPSASSSRVVNFDWAVTNVGALMASNGEMRGDTCALVHDTNGDKGISVVFFQVCFKPGGVLSLFLFKESMCLVTRKTSLLVALSYVYSILLM